MQHTLRPDSSLPDNADLPNRAAIIRTARMRAPIFTSQTICPQLIARIVSLTYKWCMIVFGYADALDRDRKSTRLNSSHVAISYAVFCLKKKKIHTPGR